jgi:hypothetical protein
MENLVMLQVKMGLLRASLLQLLLLQHHNLPIDRSRDVD